MKTSLQSLKKNLTSELKRLSDVNELKKELNRLATDVRAFDLSTALSPERRQRLEKHYKNLRSTLADLQHRLDSNFEKISSLIRKSRTTSQATSKKTARRKSTKRAPAKPAAKSAKKKAVRRNKAR